MGPKALEKGLKTANVFLIVIGVTVIGVTTFITHHDKFLAKYRSNLHLCFQIEYLPG